MAKASAGHILADDENVCREFKTLIEGGADFAELAGTHSTCRRPRAMASRRMRPRPVNGIAKTLAVDRAGRSVLSSHRGQSAASSP